MFYLNPRLRQIDTQSHFLAQEHIWIMRLLEQRLQFLQLLWSERRSIAALHTAFRHERDQHSDNRTHTLTHSQSQLVTSWSTDNVTGIQTFDYPNYIHRHFHHRPSIVPVLSQMNQVSSHAIFKD